MPLFNYQSDLSVSVFLVISYLLLSSVIAFDRKQIKAFKKGLLPSNFSLLPLWMEYLYWLEIVFVVLLLLINWKLAAMSFLIKKLFLYAGLLPYLGDLLVQLVKKLKIG